MAVTAESFANCFGVSAVLQRERKRDRGISRARIGLGTRFVIVQEQLREAAVAEPGHRRCVGDRQAWFVTVAVRATRHPAATSFAATEGLCDDLASHASAHTAFGCLASQAATAPKGK